MLVDDEEERANNRAGLDKLAGMLKSEEQSSDPASVMKDLESSRDKLLQQAQQSKAAKMQPLEAPENAGNANGTGLDVAVRLQ